MFVKGDVIYVPAHHEGDRLQGVLKGKVRDTSENCALVRVCRTAAKSVLA